MPAVKMQPPERGTYKYVLRRYDFNHNYPLLEQGYDEAQHSRSIDFRGRRSCTLFVRGKNLRELATRSGWKDESEIWFMDLEGRSDEEAPAPPPPPKPVVKKAAPVPAPKKGKK